MWTNILPISMEPGVKLAGRNVESFYIGIGVIILWKLYIPIQGVPTLKSLWELFVCVTWHSW